MKEMNTWQLCPKCNGVGSYIDFRAGITVFSTVTCDLCNGSKIISKETGLPPIDLNGNKSSI